MNSLERQKALESEVTALERQLDSLCVGQEALAIQADSTAGKLEQARSELALCRVERSLPVETLNRPTFITID